MPQVSLYSAKVLRNEQDPIDPSSPNAVFSDVERVEDQLKRAVEYFHREYGCRVFNLSVGHGDRIYEGGRQLPWAELLDDLARTLDIVIVVSAGNVSAPDIPIAVNSHQFQKQVADSLKQAQHRLIDPATSALCLTVGAVARREDPRISALGTQLAASDEGCPSPFTRCGPGVAGAVKPEVVAPGGNYALDSVAGVPLWAEERSQSRRADSEPEFCLWSSTTWSLRDQLRGCAGDSHCRANRGVPTESIRYGAKPKPGTRAPSGLGSSKRQRQELR